MVNFIVLLAVCSVVFYGLFAMMVSAPIFTSCVLVSVSVVAACIDWHLRRG